MLVVTPAKAGREDEWVVNIPGCLAKAYHYLFPPIILNYFKINIVSDIFVVVSNNFKTNSSYWIFARKFQKKWCWSVVLGSKFRSFKSVDSIFVCKVNFESCLFTSIKFDEAISIKEIILDTYVWIFGTGIAWYHCSPSEFERLTCI